MSCLFCDQTPETVAAREKLAMIAKLLNCPLVSVLVSVQSILTENGYLRMQQESCARDRDNWRQEAHKAQREARYQNYNERMTPTFYKERWSQVFEKPDKPEVPKVVAPLINQLEALPKGKK